MKLHPFKMIGRLFKIFAFLGAFTLSAACGKTAQYIIQYQNPLASPQSNLAWVGSSKADITPPPGFPMAGFSSLSDYNQGVRSKIMVKVIYLKPAQGRPIAFVQCDLLSGSLILHHKVAEMIADKTDIDFNNLIIAGTHNHSGPGQYFESQFYNDHASNAPGFDPQYFDFLTFQISQAVIQAYQNRKEAKIATAKTNFYGLTINRSFPAFLKNKDLPKTISQDPRQAVNPGFFLIRIDAKNTQGNFYPHSLISSYSIHPNAPPVLMNQLSQADIPGYFTAALENLLKNHYQAPWELTHIFLNQTCGDNNPFFNGQKDSYPLLQKAADFLTQNAFKLFLAQDQQLKSDFEVKISSQELNLKKPQAFSKIKIASFAAVGCSIAAGALGKPISTPILNWLPPFSPGHPKTNASHLEHAEKRILLGPLQSLFIPQQDFPHLFFYQLLQIDQFFIAALPAEITYQMGERMKQSLYKILISKSKTFVNDIFIVGYANGYFGYIPTAEEYSLQYYEGGHTLYGPYFGQFVTQLLENLAQSFFQEPAPLINSQRWRFQFNLSDYYPAILSYRASRQIFLPPRFFSFPDTRENFWSFQWLDVPPYLINLHQSLVQLETSTDQINWQPIPDQFKTEFSVLVHIPYYCHPFFNLSLFAPETQLDSRYIYEVRWHNFIPGQGKYFRFVILPRNKMPVFYSPIFK